MSQVAPQIKVVFNAARLLPPDQRGRYLDETCANDAELRRKVEDLLAAFDEAGAFLESPTLPQPRPRNGDEAPTASIASRHRPRVHHRRDRDRRQRQHRHHQLRRRRPQRPGRRVTRSRDNAKRTAAAYPRPFF